MESQPTEVAGSVTTHPQLLPEGGHSSVGGHGSFGSVSSSLMGVTLGYPSGHPDPHSSIIASVVESQSTASSAAITTSTVSADTSDLPPTRHLARQPPIGIETAAATNPTQVIVTIINKHFLKLVTQCLCCFRIILCQIATRITNSADIRCKSSNPSAFS